jgi:hypothetical protein
MTQIVVNDSWIDSRKWPLSEPPDYLYRDLIIKLRLTEILPAFPYGVYSEVKVPHVDGYPDIEKSTMFVWPNGVCYVATRITLYTQKAVFTGVWETHTYPVAERDGTYEFKLVPSWCPLWLIQAGTPENIVISTYDLPVKYY